ncbi:MAG: flagellar biosynthetic protein FliR [Erythrobacter sp.]|uniref:flagellar biosynthetic protein FliR n=1 Tax=Erythrobacter sp. TaxID=1042 RepID=UPI0032974631
MENSSDTILAIMLVTLRLGPSIAFAPPFTLFRVPITVRVLLSISLSIWLIVARPELVARVSEAESFVLMVFGELLVGVGLALGLQLAFAAIVWSGRALDIQAGFGLATLADPTTNARIPLAGTILSYGAGIIFFTIGAHYDLIALWAASFDALPIGYQQLQPDIGAIASVLSTLFLLAVGLVGVSMLSIFLTDLTIAFLSRTLPQMNVLLLGFQVKAMVMLVTLPICLTFAMGIYLRIIRIAVTEPAAFWQVIP